MLGLEEDIDKEHQPLNSCKRVVRGLGLVKIFNFVIKVAKMPVVKSLEKISLKELPNVCSKATSKIKSKKIGNILQSDLPHSLVDAGAAYVHSKLS